MTELTSLELPFVSAVAHSGGPISWRMAPLKAMKHMRNGKKHCLTGAAHLMFNRRKLPPRLVEQRIVVLPRSAAGASFARPAAVERRGGFALSLIHI